MDESLQRMAAMNFDPELKQIQDGSIASMQMMGKTFCGILIAFQQQINRDKEHEDKLSDIYTKITKIENNILATNRSINAAVNDINTKLHKQESDTKDKMDTIEDNVLSVQNNLKNECKSIMETVSKRLNDSSKNVENVENELSKYLVQLQSMSSKVTDTLHSVNEKQQNMESQMAESQNEINDKICFMNEKLTQQKEHLTERIRDVKANFETLRFEVDTIASNKADVADLKRKTNVNDFNDLSDTVSNITNKFTTNMDDIQQKVHTNHTELETNMSKTKQVTEKALSNLDDEMNRMNTSLGELQYKLNNKQNSSNLNGDDNDMVNIIRRLQKDMDEMMETVYDPNANAKNQTPAMGATGSGSCFSCGQRVNSSFPALPTRRRSPDKKNIGGGFTFDHVDKNTKFNEAMRNELSQIANEISSTKSTHKFPIERKPVKLPTLKTSNTVPKL
eukprot:36643_1